MIESIRPFELPIPSNIAMYTDEPTLPSSEPPKTPQTSEPEPDYIIDVEESAQPLDDISTAIPSNTYADTVDLPETDNSEADSECTYSLYEEYSVPSNQNGFKSWMPASVITAKKSPQYKLLQLSESDENGMYKIGEHFSGAMGSYYSYNAGDLFEVTLSTGKVFTVFMGDLKDNKHTDSIHQRTRSNGCVIEFLVDMKKFKGTKSYRSGDISSIGFEGTFVKIVKIGNIADELGIELKWG